MNLSDEDSLEIVTWAKRHPLIKQVYLYGSRARGDNRENSDIDLAIEMDFQEWFEWNRKFKESPDLHLSHIVHVEWYKKDASLQRVGLAVQKDGVLLYFK